MTCQLASAEPLPFTLENTTPHCSLVYGKKKHGSGANAMYYEALVACFEFSDKRVVARQQDGSVVIEDEWNDDLDEKSLSNKKLADALLRIFQQQPPDEM